MKNKKGLVVGTLVTVIVLALVLVVVLRFHAAILALIKGLGEDYFGCLLKKIISAYTKTPIGTEVWGAFCPPVVYTITLDKKGENFIPIDVEFSKREIKNLEKWYKEKGYDFEESSWYRQYRLDEAMVKGVKLCWNRNGQGELPLGPQWNKLFFEGGPIAYCDLCAVYKFDSEVQDIFKGSMSLKDFMMANPVRPGSPQSVWEYVKDEGVVTDLRDIRYSTDKDQAVVFERFNINYFNEFFRDVIDILPGYYEEKHPVPIDVVRIIPFENFEELNCRT